MYKKLKINPDFQNLIPPLPEDEFNQLEQNILSAGKCRDTIKVWKNYIIDGHNRYEICQKHGIPYDVEDLRFSSKDDAKLWIAENQLGRRNLTKAMRIELALLKTKLLPKTSNTRKTIAEIAGVGDRTVYKYMKITGSGSEELIRRVRNGEINISSAHKTLGMNTRKVEVLYDANDLRFKNTPMCHHNVIWNLNEIDRMYGFFLNDGAIGSEDVLKRLKGHVGTLEGLLKNI